MTRGCFAMVAVVVMACLGTPGFWWGSPTEETASLLASSSATTLARVPSAPEFPLAGEVFVRQDPQDPESDKGLSQRMFMRQKLMYSQNIVEGLSIRRYDLVEQAAAEIIAITHADGFLPQPAPRLQRANEEFRAAAEALKKAALEQNLEGAALRYFDLTLKCIDCHEMLRKADF